MYKVTCPSCEHEWFGALTCNQCPYYVPDDYWCKARDNKQYQDPTVYGCNHWWMLCKKCGAELSEAHASVPDPWKCESYPPPVEEGTSALIQFEDEK